MNEGLAATLVVVGTIAGVLFGVRVQARKDARGVASPPARGRELWVPASLLALSIAFAGLVLGIAIELLGRWADRDHLLVWRPVGEVRIRQSVDAAAGATAPWRAMPGLESADLQVEPVPAGRRGEDGALRVTVDLPGPRGPVAIQVSSDDLPDSITAATARVYVENSPAARKAGLHARLVGRMRAGSSGSFSLVGDRIPLRPGAWTQVVWTGSYTLELSRALGGDSTSERKISASQRLTFMSVRLESDRPYRGSIFVDDLRLYAAEASAPDASR